MTGTTERPAVGRWPAVTLSLIIGLLTLALTLATVRAVLLAQVEQQADETITQEVRAFISFVEGSHHIGDGEEPRYADEAELMRSFLARQTPESHEALVTISAGEVMFLDNARHAAGRRFAESEAAMESVLGSEETSGTLHTDAFGEVRWGRVTTDQDGTFLVLHFTAPAQADAREVVTLMAAVGGAALLVVAVLVWLAAPRLITVQLNRPRRSTLRRLPRRLPRLLPGRSGPRPGRGSATSAASDLRADTGADLGSHADPDTGVPDVDDRPHSTTLARVVLEAQRRIRTDHPELTLRLAREGQAAYDAGSAEAAMILGELAGIEADLDAPALCEALAALADELPGELSDELPPGELPAEQASAGGPAVVVLSAGTVPSTLSADQAPALRFSVHAEPHQTPDPETAVPAAVPAGSSAPTLGQHGISHPEAPPQSPVDASDRGTLADQVAAAHQGWCWRVSGPGSLRRAGVDLPRGRGDGAGRTPEDEDEATITARLPVPLLGLRT